MSVGEDEIQFVKDLFAEVGEITTRKMMGGLSIYANGKIFSVLRQDGQLYIKASGPLAEQLDAAGGKLFTYDKKNGKQGHMNYWTLPEAALDDPEAACEWAKASLDAN
ncbi:MAG: TfoX/Sxy family protein [Rhodobacteraceae bacterium]|nr:TfoX/Sxy family protein [Paracoccaceae bacterium]